MKGLALALWLTAIALLVCILQMNAKTSPRTDALTPERSLLMLVPTIVPLPQEPVSAMAAIAVAEKLAFVAGCSRLGVFPRRDWAERVAVILTETMPSAPVEAAAVAEASHLIEEAAAKPWRVQHIGLDAYYLQFDAWGIDELAARMTLQRALLKRLLSINAIPEAC